MFRKHIALTALIIAALTVITPAEAAYQDANATYSPFCCAKEECNTTRSGIRTTYGHPFTTTSPTKASNLDCITTCSTFWGNRFELDSTAMPLAALTANHFPGSVSAQMPSTVEDYTTQYVSAQEQMMMNLINQDRKNNGLSPLAYDPELSRIARIKSKDMRDNRYFAHESPVYGNVRQMLRSFGYDFSGAGENIAHHANVDKAQAAFMSSKGHRSNILSTAWTKVGIGICLDANGFIYATQIFAR